MSDHTTSAASVPVGSAVTPPSPEEIAARAPIVEAMLNAAGITLADDERRRLTEMYAMYRPGIAAMYAVPEARYEVPALLFQAAPRLQAWGA